MLEDDSISHFRSEKTPGWDGLYQPVEGAKALN
jgi:hypothetical protein